MEFEEYNLKIRSINNQVQNVATATFNMAMMGTASPNNPEFNRLMHEHNRLTAESDTLTENMAQQLKRKAAIKDQKSKD